MRTRTVLAALLGILFVPAGAAAGAARAAPTVRVDATARAVPPSAGIWRVTPAPASVQQVSCGGQGFCVATGYLGFAGSTTNAIVVTHDYGTDWSYPPVPPDISELDSVSCGSPVHCVVGAVGGPGNCDCQAEFLVSSDGGGTWKEVVLPFGSYAVPWLSCADATHCLAGTQQSGELPSPVVVLSTDDGGLHWSRPGSGTFDYRAEVGCRSASSCVVVTGGHDPSGSGFPDEPMSVLRSSDEGATWTRLGGPLTGMLMAAPPACPGALNCVVVGTSSSASPPPAGAGAAWTTSDGGSTWTRGSLPPDIAALSAVSCSIPSHCWATATSVAGSARQTVVLASVDGGRSWSTVLDLGTDFFSAISCAPAGTCLAFGTAGEARLTGPVVAIAATADGTGYYLATTDGTVYAFGKAPFAGDMAARTLSAPIVAMAVDPVTGGYWLLGRDGGVFSFRAPYFGSTAGLRLAAGVVAMAAAPAGRGYRFVASDGGVFDFGPSARFHGSMGGMHLNAPIVGMASDAATGGYWLVASDGGIFGFDARFLGSAGSIRLAAPVVGMAATPAGTGYRLVAEDGGIFDYGAVRYSGSLVVNPASPVVGIAVQPNATGYWLAQAVGTVTRFGGAG
jgi:photosystem II stability/assembly factor-like uncharacterized protein